MNPRRRLAPDDGASPDHDRSLVPKHDANAAGASGKYRLADAGSRPGPSRRYEAIQMEAVRPGPPAGRTLDFDLDLQLDPDVGANGALELACAPSSHRVEAARPVSQKMQAVRRPPSGDHPAPARSPQPAVERSSGRLPAVDPHAALVSFAGFGEPPSSLWGAPRYAMRVLARRRVLRAGLLLARERRSRDIGVYEAALQAADATCVRHGLLVAGAAAGLVVVLLLLAVARVLFASNAAL